MSFLSTSLGVSTSSCPHHLSINMKFRKTESKKGGGGKKGGGDREEGGGKRGSGRGRR